MNKNDPKKKDLEPDHLGVIGFIVALLFQGILTVLGTVLGSLWRGICHLAKQHFTFDRLTNQEIKRRVLSALIVLGFFILGMYTLWGMIFPKWESNTHTVNLMRTNEKIPFPSHTDFKITTKREVLSLSLESNFTYITYPTETNDGLYPAILGESGICQTVPHGRSLVVYSSELPVAAIGFEDTLIYRDVDIREIPLSRKIPFFVFSLTSGESEKRKRTIEKIGKEGTWDTFVEEWSSLYSIKGSRVFLVKARHDENALICF
jgi:hypothetical protein